MFTHKGAYRFNGPGSGQQRAQVHQIGIEVGPFASHGRCTYPYKFDEPGPGPVISIRTFIEYILVPEIVFISIFDALLTCTIFTISFSFSFSHFLFHCSIQELVQYIRIL